jgi:hypothetical protein
LKMNDLSP